MKLSMYSYIIISKNGSHMKLSMYSYIIIKKNGSHILCIIITKNGSHMKLSLFIGNHYKMSKQGFRQGLGFRVIENDLFEW